MAVFGITIGVVFLSVFAVAISRIVKAVGGGLLQGKDLKNAGFDMQHEQAMRMHNDAHNQAVHMHNEAHNTAMNMHNHMFHM